MYGNRFICYRVAFMYVRSRIGGRVIMNTAGNASSMFHVKRRIMLEPCAQSLTPPRLNLIARNFISFKKFYLAFLSFVLLLISESSDIRTHNVFIAPRAFMCRNDVPDYVYRRFFLLCYSRSLYTTVLHNSEAVSEIAYILRTLWLSKYTYLYISQSSHFILIRFFLIKLISKFLRINLK